MESSTPATTPSSVIRTSILIPDEVWAILGNGKTAIRDFTPKEIANVESITAKELIELIKDTDSYSFTRRPMNISRDLELFCKEKYGTTLYRYVIMAFLIKRDNEE